MTEKERAARLHERATTAAEAIKSGEKNLVEIFHEMDLFKGYRFYGAKNLYEYAMKVHKLSEPTALNIINVARKSKEVPELRHAVVSGEITLSKARKIVPVITRENKDAWLELAKTSTKRVIEKAVATERPELAVVESAKYTAGDRVTVILNLTEEAFENLKRVMDIESQRTRAGVGKGEAAARAFDTYLEKFDPIRQAERAKLREERNLSKIQREPQLAKGKTCGDDKRTVQIGAKHTAASVPGQVQVRQVGVLRNQGRRKALSAVLRHAVDMRDRRQCTYVDDRGWRCQERRWLDYHHIVPLEQGGADSLENLVTLCSGHHRWVHARRRGVAVVRELGRDYGLSFPRQA